MQYMYRTRTRLIEGYSISQSSSIIVHQSGWWQMSFKDGTLIIHRPSRASTYVVCAYQVTNDQPPPVLSVCTSSCHLIVHWRTFRTPYVILCHLFHLHLETSNLRSHSSKLRYDRVFCSTLCFRRSDLRLVRQ